MAESELIEKEAKDREEHSNIERIIRHFLSDENAVRLMLDIWLIIQAWDDAYDNDPADHCPAYRAAMISLPTNPIYQNFPISLLIKQMFFDWQAANEFEYRKEHLHKSYLLRAGFYRVLLTVISFIHGDKAAENQAAAVWRCYGETFQQYQEEMNNA